MNIYEEVEAFYRAFRGEKKIYGESAEGRKLFAVRIGSEEGSVGISQYAIHGREYITALLALAHARRGVRRGSVWILPLTNPDGALLSEVGLESASPKRREALLRINGSEDFSLWKANAEGIDLNVNFDAKYGMGAENRRFPASEGYIGTSPFCAAETRALREFTLEVSPRYTVSWHTKGEEIYYEFHTPLLRRLRDKKYARVLEKSTGYPLARTRNSAGGYKDWCIEKLGIPAFTVEAGRNSLPHPLGRGALPELLTHALDALYDLSAVF